MYLIMKQLSTLQVSEFAKQVISFSNYKNVFGIGDMGGEGITLGKSYGERLSVPMRLQAILIILVTAGKAKISLDNVSYELSENHLIFIMPSHITQITHTSDDLKGQLLLADVTFLEECKPDNINPSLVNYMRLRKNPRVVLDPDETIFLERYLHLMKERITKEQHYFRVELLHIHFIAFLLELVNIVMEKKKSIPMPKLTSKEEIVNKFLQLLLQHFKEEHAITFYADKLCITSQYLSSVLKIHTGKTASEWIDEAILAEAKVLLKSPKMTILQVSQILNFADQSTFGKFFKKHVGISPTLYKKS